MDSAGDYLYLAVVAIAAISSIMRKRKKAEEKKNQQNSRPIVIEQPQVYEEKEEDDWWNQAKEVILPEVKVVPPLRPDDLRSYETVADPEELRVKSNHLTKMMPDFEEPEQNTQNVKENGLLEKLRLNNPDQAKLAFIYSEIFNRKY